MYFDHSAVLMSLPLLFSEQVCEVFPITFECMKLCE